MNIKENLEEKSNEELKRIYKNDENKWRKKAVEIAGKILKERGKDVPERESEIGVEFEDTTEEMSKNVENISSERDVTVERGTGSIALIGLFGVLSIVVGLTVMVLLFSSGDPVFGWFHEVSGILLIILGLVGLGFSLLISIVRDIMNKQNKLLFRMLKVKETSPSHSVD